jgi:hypothetical protein
MLRLTVALLVLPCVINVTPGFAAESDLRELLKRRCFECHNSETSKDGLDLTQIAWQLDDPLNRQQWVHIHDRVVKGEMPPEPNHLPESERAELLGFLKEQLHEADLQEVQEFGRGPMRRLNRDEYEQNLRDALQLPNLDIRDMLPEDREDHRFNKSAAALDISRIQLAAWLDAADAALKKALATGVEPPEPVQYHALATRMFQEAETFGNREAMFYAKDSRLLPLDGRQLSEIRASGKHDPAVEMALFRSASWPYYGYPEGFIARWPGEYRVRFSARAVLQREGYELRPATQPQPMTFRARAPSGPDVSGDVRATGGLIDIQPEVAVYETQIQLRENETFEYSLLGLPVPLARNVDNGPPTYRYPPFPETGQPGVAFQWIEVTGPLSPSIWPPASHRVLFDELPLIPGTANSVLPVEVVSKDPARDAKRLLSRFVLAAARTPVPDEVVKPFEQLILSRFEQQVPFAEAMLAGYAAFLCSPHFLYLPEPQHAEDHFAIASRLSHFLTNSRPDAELMEHAAHGRLRTADILRAEADRLIADPKADRFVKSFTDYWLDLRHLRRDDPDIRLYPEYRFDDYLVESMERETREFFALMLRENLSATVLIDSDFVLVNDRLTRHYGLPPVTGSAIRRVAIPKDSPYGGLLTQAAMLKVTSNGTSTSPVVRGAWIMERLIGDPPPPPPASVPAVEPDIRGAKTIRELLALHTQSESCAKCHARFDPVGLALENFDILGGWRTQYRGQEFGQSVTGIDRAGHDFSYTLTQPVDAAGTLRDGRSFNTIQDMKSLLLKDPRQLARNLLHQFTIYATGTPVRFSDRAEIEQMLDECDPGGYRVRDLIHALITSRVFLGHPE